MGPTGDVEPGEALSKVRYIWQLATQSMELVYELGDPLTELLMLRPYPAHTVA